MTPFWWACCTAWQTGTNSSSRSAGRQVVLVAELGDGHALDQLHDEVRPARRRCAPASSTLAMLGWSIRARACRSASNRATTWRVSMPGLRTFRATLRRTGCGLLGHEDDAEAALADLLQQLVRPDHRARAVADGRQVDGRRPGPGRGASRKLPISRLGREEPFDARPQGRVAAAGLGPGSAVRSAGRQPAGRRGRRLRGRVARRAWAAPDKGWRIVMRERPPAPQSGGAFFRETGSGPGPPSSQ